MKGLLLKDWYQTVKYCRTYLIIVLVFMALGVFSQEDLGFTVVYPFLLGGMIPVNMISYDTASHWESMSLTLPYTRGQIVSGKYVLCLCFQGGILVFTALTQTARMCMRGTFGLEALVLTLLPLAAMALIVPSLMLPVIYKLGVEKGRMLYLAFIGLTFAIVGITATNADAAGVGIHLPVYAGAAALGIAAALFAVSWGLSIRFYSKREL